EIHLRSAEIVRSLGLEPIGGMDDGKWSSHMLRPVMPFWVALDTNYGSADSQAWSTKRSPWSIDSKDGRPSGEGIPPSNGGATQLGGGTPPSDGPTPLVQTR